MPNGNDVGIDNGINDIIKNSERNGGINSKKNSQRKLYLYLCVGDDQLLNKGDFIIYESANQRRFAKRISFES